MNVLSLFNGMSFGMMALESLNIKVDNYYSSEIDKYANQATKALYPGIIQVGDVTKWRDWTINLGAIDLLLAGFPCQAWSMAGKQEGNSDPRGALVHDLIAIWQEINKQRLAIGKEPVKFMFENVKMKKQFLDYINNLFGVEPICINSALVSAQNRVRYYWNNMGCIDQPQDTGINLIDILEDDIDHKFYHSEKALQYMNRCVKGGRNHWDFGHHSTDTDDKSACLTANHHKGVPYNCLIITDRALARIDRKTYSSPKYNPEKTGTMNTKNNTGQMSIDSGTTIVSSGSETKGFARRLSPLECARLQSVPEDKIQILLSSGVSNTQLYKMLGNGWNMETVKHVLSGLQISSK